jgi:DNA topoisomerase VI subunit A
MSENVVGKIKREAKGVEEAIVKRKKPSLKFPVRSLANVRYVEKAGYFETREEEGRTLTVTRSSRSPRRSA